MRHPSILLGLHSSALRACALLSLFGGRATATSAQVVTPSIAVRGPRHPDIRPTPAEALANLMIEKERAESEVIPPTQARYPKDSLRIVAEQRAQRWLATLQRSSFAGLQLDPYGMLAMRAHQDAFAQQQIATRLATQGLSLPDRAYTLQAAIEMFADADYPDRLPIAERYVAQLDALGPDAAYWQLNARKGLIYAYYRLGRATDVVRVGLQAFNVVDRIPFEMRGNVMYSPGIAFPYAAVIDALSGQPHGRDSVRALNTRLLAAAIAPAEYVARDSFFVYVAEGYHELMHGQVVMSERIGQPGTPLVANYWVNRSTTRDSQTVAVNDGRIRVVEIGSWTWAPCMMALTGLERLHHRYPMVEFNFMTAGSGIWGNRIVPPQVEAERLADHFTKKLGVTFPIGIAMPTRVVSTDDGGHAMRISTPTLLEEHYPQASRPSFYILDGKGTIRHVMGGYSRDLEENLAAIIEFLQHESQQAMPSSVQQTALK